MQRRITIQTSSLIILLSILTIIAEFIAYYLFDSIYLILAITCLLSIISCHILLQVTATYEACFQYSVLTLFISLMITFISYFGKVQVLLVYTDAMLILAAFNWIIPLLHCFLRYMIEYGVRLEGFLTFYRNTSILFLSFYFVILFYGAFATNAFSWAYPKVFDSFNLFPFGIISAQIEDYLYGNISLSEILTYLLTRILPFLPFGFYSALLLSGRKHLTRFLALLLFPLSIEILQIIIVPARCDIDDIIYALMGGYLGVLIYFLVNLIFKAFTGKNFALNDNQHYGYGNSRLHF